MEYTYKNIVIFSNGAIGDFLMAILFLDNLRKTLPKARYTILVPRNAKILRQLALAYPFIFIVEINSCNFLHHIYFLIILSLRKIIVIRSVSFSNLPLTLRILCKVLTIRMGSKNIGFSDKSILKGKTFDYSKLVYENIIDLFNSYGFTVQDMMPKYKFIPIEDVISKYGLSYVDYVVIHPCASHVSRSMPVIRWVEIFEYILNSFPMITIVVTGNKQDFIFITKIITRLSIKNNSIVNLAGMLSLNELTTIINMATKGYIGVDTGISHLAAVLRKRSVIIGNLSNPCWLPFYNENSIVLANNTNCTCNGKKGGNCFYVIDGQKYYKCMIDIPNTKIYKNISVMLECSLS